MKKIVRVVTSNYCIPAHLDNTLKRIPSGFQMYILGENVTKYSSQYQEVRFIDLPIKRKISIINDFFVLIKMIAIYNQIKPDITHSIMTKAGFFAAIVGKLTGVKVRIHTFTGQVWSTKKGIKRLVLVFVDKLICFLNTNCLTDSPSQSEFLFNYGIKKGGEKLGCLLKGSLSGVDIEKFSIQHFSMDKSKLMQNLNLDPSNFIIGYIARKSLDKGCIDILNIFSLINNDFPHTKLLYIGPDESNGEIDAFYKLNPRVRENIIEFGFVHNHEYFLSLCNVLCLPSHREGFGSIVIDAASLGIPTVGSLIPGLIDSVIDGKTGYLIPVGDFQKFSRKIATLISEKDLRISLGENARSFAVNSFDANKINDSLYNFYIKETQKAVK